MQTTLQYKSLMERNCSGVVYTQITQTIFRFKGHIVHLYQIVVVDTSISRMLRISIVKEMLMKYVLIFILFQLPTFVLWVNFDEFRLYWQDKNWKILQKY